MAGDCNASGLGTHQAGAIRFDGVDLAGLGAKQRRALRRHIQMVFQDPYASLDPRQSVGEIVVEGLLAQGLGRWPALRERAADLLQSVGLPRSAVARAPHEFSGGQRQRIGIARALAVQPRLIVADEPVSALDLSVQAQILNLLFDQQRARGLALLFIGHDLSVIRHFCDRVLVLYRGQVVESGDTASLFATPRHPYTRALIAAAPASHPAQRRLRPSLAGDPPSALEPLEGCVFRARCPHALDSCASGRPPLRPVGDAHLSACLRDDL